MILTEIFEIIGLLFEIIFHKTGQLIEKVKTKGQQYLRALKWLVGIAILVPLILLVLGIVLRDHSLIGWAGIILAVATFAFAAITRPLIFLIETIYRYFKKSENSETLARRYTSAIISALIVELIVTLYFVLIPWETNPGLMVPILIALIIIVISVMQVWSKIGGFVRAFAFFIAILVFLVSTASFVLPKTFGELQKSIPALDEKLQKDIKEGNTSLIENKPTSDLESTDTSENPAQASKPVRDSSSVNKAAAKKKTQPKKVTSSSMKRPRGFIAELTNAGNDEWKDFIVPGSVRDAVPTNIKVQRGDSIDFDAIGQITVLFTDRNGEHKEGSFGPEGTWPSWMTQELYRSKFIEHESNTCWNAVFRIGSDSAANYFAIQSNSTHIARSDGMVWLRINDDPKSTTHDAMNDLFEGEFGVAVRIRPASQSFRDSLQRIVQDSIFAFEKKHRDSIFHADEVNRQIARKDSLSGWKTIFFNVGVPEAFPTNISVATGDSIEFQASGQAAVFILSYRRALDGWSIKEDFLISPEGTWPVWMEAERYLRAFRETYSRKCWNLSFRLTENKTNQMHSIGENAAYYVASAGGDIWLKMNRIVGWDAFDPFLKDSITGQFVVKIRVIHGQEPRSQIDTAPPKIGQAEDSFRAQDEKRARVELDERTSGLLYDEWRSVFEGPIYATTSDPVMTSYRYRAFDSLSIAFSGERSFKTPYGLVAASGCGVNLVQIQSANEFPVPDSPPFAVLIGLGNGYVTLFENTTHSYFCGEIPGGPISIQNNVPPEWCNGSGSTDVEVKIKKVILR